jgi:hypothetical protein
VAGIQNWRGKQLNNARQRYRGAVGAVRLCKLGPWRFHAGRVRLTDGANVRFGGKVRVRGADGRNRERDEDDRGYNSSRARDHVDYYRAEA